jgi:hypothetical protein
MGPLRALVIYIALVFLGGALLAPWLYWLAQSFAHEFPGIAGNPFHRFLDRSIMGLALIGLWPFLRSVGADSLKELGLARSGGRLKQFGGGLLLGFVSLAAVAGFALAAGAQRLSETVPPARLGEKIPGIALTAVVVAVLEETLFRGVLFGSLRKVFNWVFALTLSSLIYASVHFMESANPMGAVTWLSGLELLPRMLRGVVDPRAIFPGFVNLTLAGGLLGLAYQRTGSLYCSIGLHAGWIFWIKLYGLMIDPARAGNVWPWGTAKLIDGWFALPVLAATVLIFAQWPVGRNRKPPHERLRAF